MTKKLLLDTHIWLWLMDGDKNLGSSFRNEIDVSGSNRSLFVSAISVWEIAMLQMKGKIRLGLPVAAWVDLALNRSEINLIPLSPAIAIESCALPDHFHGDPADRIIAATARVENLCLITKDANLIEYGRKKYLTVL